MQMSDLQPALSGTSRLSSHGGPTSSARLLEMLKTVDQAGLALTCIHLDIPALWSSAWSCDSVRFSLALAREPFEADAHVPCSPASGKSAKPRTKQLLVLDLPLRITAVVRLAPSNPVLTSSLPDLALQAQAQLRTIRERVSLQTRA